MTKYRPAVGRHKVLAVIKFNGRRLGFRVDTPFVRQPASVENVRAEQNNSRDQHNYKCVHVFSSLSGNDLRFRSQRYAKKPSSMQEDHEDDPAKTKAYTLLYLLPRYHFACRQYAADLSLPPGTAFFRRAFPVNGGYPASTTRHCL